MPADHLVKFSFLVIIPCHPLLNLLALVFYFIHCRCSSSSSSVLLPLYSEERSLVDGHVVLPSGWLIPYLSGEVLVAIRMHRKSSFFFQIWVRKPLPSLGGGWYHEFLRLWLWWFSSASSLLHCLLQSPRTRGAVILHRRPDATLSSCWWQQECRLVEGKPSPVSYGIV